jgi:hypothetical protein
VLPFTDAALVGSQESLPPFEGAVDLLESTKMQKGRNIWRARTSASDSLFHRLLSTLAQRLHVKQPVRRSLRCHLDQTLLAVVAAPDFVAVRH